MLPPQQDFERYNSYIPFQEGSSIYINHDLSFLNRRIFKIEKGNLFTYSDDDKSFQQRPGSSKQPEEYPSFWIVLWVCLDL